MKCEDIRAQMMAAAQAGDEVACATAALALAAKKARGGDYCEASAIKEAIDGNGIGYRRIVAGIKAKFYRAMLCNQSSDDDRHMIDMLAKSAIADVVEWMNGPKVRNSKALAELRACTEAARMMESTSNQKGTP